MNAHLFMVAVGVVFFGWLIHTAWWRLARPRDDLKALAVCLVLLPAVLLFSAFLLNGLEVTPFFLALILSTSLGGAYCFWYPAAQAASPTMLITILVKEAGSDGLSDEGIREKISEEALSGKSIESLLNEQFARKNDSGEIELAPRGKRTLAMIRLLRYSAGFDDPKG